MILPSSQFVFYPTNHSVIRGEYTGSDACGPGGCNPCIPWEIIHPDQKEKAFHSDNQMTQFVLPANAAVNVCLPHLLLQHSELITRFIGLSQSLELYRGVDRPRVLLLQCLRILYTEWNDRRDQPY
jgi:hypothetical protein